MYRSLLLLVILMFLAPVPFQAVHAACNPDAFLRRVSVSSSGEQGNGYSTNGSISANGRVALFLSAATNLVPNDTNGQVDAFVHNLDTCETRILAVNAAGEQANGYTSAISLSGDGRLVVFQSDATNLVPDDTNNTVDVFIRDMLTGTIQRISVGAGGVQADGESGDPQISDDGKFVVFWSYATNLLSSITLPGNDIRHVYAYDLQSGLMDLVSINQFDQPANQGATQPDISADGRFVAFTSNATNLVPGATGVDRNVFRFDRLARTVELVSTGLNPWERLNRGEWPSISGDGRYVVFVTTINPSGRVFVRDLQAASTLPVSINWAGELGDCNDTVGSISANGRFVSLLTCSGNLAPGAMPWATTILARDLWTGEIRQIALTWDGQPIPGAAESNPWSAVSAEGEAYIFMSTIALVPEDTNGFADVYVTGLPPASPIIPQRNFYTVQNPVLTWAGTSNAIRYELQVARTAAFTPPLAFQTTVNAPQQEAEVTLIAGQYFWRVRACTGPTTCGAWSEVDSLVIELP